MYEKANGPVVAVVREFCVLDKERVEGHLGVGFVEVDQDKCVACDSCITTYKCPPMHYNEAGKVELTHSCVRDAVHVLMWCAQPMPLLKEGEIIMKYQIVIAGIGGQGAVFLVKVLSIASSLAGQKCLGTENHGMSQRGGSVSCYVKIGDFYAPAIDEGQADLLIALEGIEALRNVPVPQKGWNHRGQCRCQISKIRLRYFCH